MVKAGFDLHPSEEKCSNNHHKMVVTVYNSRFAYWCHLCQKWKNNAELRNIHITISNRLIIVKSDILLVNNWWYVKCYFIKLNKCCNWVINIPALYWGGGGVQLFKCQPGELWYSFTFHKSWPGYENHGYGTSQKQCHKYLTT
jgi:hypothetical protein